jgi:hypothetical protein
MEPPPSADASPAALAALLQRVVRAGTVVVCVVAVPACGGTESHNPSAANNPSGPSARVGAERVSIAPRSGWAALPSRRKIGHGSPPLAFLSVVNFRLDAAGRKKLRGEAIRRRDVVATISELTAGEYRGHGASRLRGPLKLGRADFLDPGSPKVPRGRAVAQRFFSTNARRFSIDAEFGRPRPSRTVVKALNRNLATLRVARR